MRCGSCLAVSLILLGAILLALAAGLFWLARTEQAVPVIAASTPAAPLPTAGGTPAPLPTLRLGPTAAAVATALPPPTPIATPAAPSTRPSAPLRIVIPALGVDALVVEVGWHVTQVGGEARGEWETVADAAGHHRGSADPGQPGNCVLSAHSSDAGGAVFRGLEELVTGDVVQLCTVDEKQYNYYVTTVLTLDEVGATAAEKREHARWLDPTDGTVLTLVTCWPPWSYTHRIVVRAELGN